MIRVELYFKKEVLWRFKVAGHAGYAEAGEDIVCSAVSLLVFNTINSITEFTNEVVLVDQIDKKHGIVDCRFEHRRQGQVDDQCTLLLKSMALGLYSIEEMYGEYIKIQTINND
jgi:hypothetical protein